MENSEQAKKRNLFYMLVIFALLVIVGYLAIQINSANKKNHDFGQKINLLNSEKNELNSILESSGIINEQDNKNLRTNLQNLLSTYDTLKFDNEKIKDSIENQKLVINNLMLEAEQLENQKKKDWGRIYKLKKETETLRSIMKGYIQTIDSLNTENINLTNSLNKTNKELSQVQSENKNIKDENQELQQTIALGSILQTTNFIAQAIRVKGNGKQTETSRASRTNMLKGCFTILENKISSAGNKYIYLRVLNPNGKVLSQNKKEVISLENSEEIEISAKREINYQNENTDVCIYYEVENAIAPGNYEVEIYADNNKIGITSFALK
jgi:chromosome segregation ATPase